MVSRLGWEVGVGWLIEVGCRDWLGDEYFHMIRKKSRCVFSYIYMYIY